MTAALIALTVAVVWLAVECLLLHRVTREDGRTIHFQRAVIDGQRVTLRNQREALRETDAALRLALACMRRYAHPDDEDGIDMSVFRRQLDEFNGGLS